MMHGAFLRRRMCGRRCSSGNKDKDKNLEAPPQTPPRESLPWNPLSQTHFMRLREQEYCTKPKTIIFHNCQLQVTLQRPQGAALQPSDGAAVGSTLPRQGTHPLHPIIANALHAFVGAKRKHKAKKYFITANCKCPCKARGALPYNRPTAQLSAARTPARGFPVKAFSLRENGFVALS